MITINQFQIFFIFKFYFGIINFIETYHPSKVIDNSRSRRDLIRDTIIKNVPTKMSYFLTEQIISVLHAKLICFNESLIDIEILS